MEFIQKAKDFGRAVHQVEKGVNWLGESPLVPDFISNRVHNFLNRRDPNVFNQSNMVNAIGTSHGLNKSSRYRSHLRKDNYSTVKRYPKQSRRRNIYKRYKQRKIPFLLQRMR